MRQTSLRGVALSGFALAAVAVMLLAGAAWNVMQQSMEAAAFVSHTHSVMSTISEAESQLSRAEAAQRAYMVALDPRFSQQRESAISQLQGRVDEVARLTSDNASQQRRVTMLQQLLDDRVAALRSTQSLLQSGGRMSPEQRLEEGTGFRDRVRPLFTSMMNEERALLKQREVTEEERARTVTLTFGALVILMLLLLPIVVWRLRADALARHAAEKSALLERRYDSLHARALTLYNAESDQQATLAGTLALLAEDGLFPVSALYLHEELGGNLRLAASRGAPLDVKPLVRMGEGPIGTAAAQREPIYLEGFEAGGGLSIETGLAVVKPAALLLCPVTHQSRLLGVLALAAAATLSERERGFVERLGAQLGVALHNLNQLRGLNELASELRERSADVERKNDELQRATRMKSEFVANMSHELRTPLNAIIGFSEVLRDGMAGALNNEQSEFVGHVNSSGKHLLSLINDILDLSKVEAGQMSLDLGPASPAELAASSALIVRHRAAIRRITLTELCEPHLGRVQVDGRKVKQIIANLLANAVKFTPEGGSVDLHMRRVTSAAFTGIAPADGTRLFPPPPPSPSSAASLREWLEIEVTDTGIGIDPAGLRELFQPFVQIDSSLTREYEGTGLGLTMVQRLTELHGGGLMARSAIGRGSSFVVWLPWIEIAEPAAVALPQAIVKQAQSVVEAQDAPCVLVIDDDAQSADLLRVQLQAHGYRVEVELDAESGLRAAERIVPQAIVLDVLMPGMDGWDMLARLKDRPATRHVPVVIVSITDEPRRGFALGAAQVLMKPIAKQELLAALAATGLRPSTAEGRVLVVDDDPSAVTIVCKHLQAAGYTPVGAYGGQEALEFVRRQRPSLIVLDLMMPHVSGFDVVESLAHHPETAGIPIIVLTAKLVTSRDRDQLRGRVQRLIEKSDFEASGLLAEVKRAMARQPMEVVT